MKNLLGFTFLLLLGFVIALPTAANAQVYVTPIDKDVAVNTKLTLTIAATGTGFQWYKNDVVIAGATSTTFIINSTKYSDSGKYTFFTTQGDGTQKIYTFNITVIGQDGVITSRPVDQTVQAGGTATFSVTASGPGLTYQWRFDGVDLAGATSSSLVLTNVGTHQRGTYSVVISNGSGVIAETPAVLSVESTARLVNLATRAYVGTGDNVVIAGFVLSGTGSKAMLLRGVGPTLASLGVTGSLATPKLSLHSSTGATVQETSGAWGGGATLTQTFSRLGASALPAGSADAAFQTSLTGSPYSVIVSGTGGATGVALAELYDASSPGDPDSPRLVNISSRARVAAGDQTLIAGFVITGSTSETLLIRGVGPGLNLAGNLSRARLTLYNSKGEELMNNIKWDTDAKVSATAAKVGAFALTANSEDGALLVTLPAGVYSAHVTGVNGATGIALVEVYEVP